MMPTVRQGRGAPYGLANLVTVTTGGSSLFNVARHHAHPTRADESRLGWRAGVGRHAVRDSADDPSVLTPIFQALVAGGGRERHTADAAAARHTVLVQHRVAAAPIEDDPLEAFRLDPLLAPLPSGLPDEPVGPDAARVAHLTAVPGTGGRRRAAHAASEQRGRHHRRLVPLDGGTSDT